MQLLRITICLAGIGLTAGEVAAQTQPLDGEAIAAIWQTRQDKVTSAAFEWTMTVMYPRGGYNHVAVLTVKPGQILPKTDTRSNTHSRFVFDGIKVRYDYHSTSFNIDTEEMDVRKEQTSFDGKHFRETTEMPDGTIQGSLSMYTNYRDFGMVSVSPIFTTFRGRTKGLTRCNPNELTSTGRRATIDGVEVLEYLVMKTSERIRHTWLAPEQGWCILRDISVFPKVNTIEKFDIRYRADPDVGWVPNSWEFSKSIGGDVKLTFRHEVTSYTVNTKVEDSEFAIKFAAGSRVFYEDPPGGSEGTILEDGRLKPDEGGRAYFLPGTGESRWRSRLRYALYVAIAVTMAFLAFRVFRRYRARRSSAIPGGSSTGGLV